MLYFIILRVELFQNSCVGKGDLGLSYLIKGGLESPFDNLHVGGAMFKGGPMYKGVT